MRSTHTTGQTLALVGAHKVNANGVGAARILARAVIHVHVTARVGVTVVACGTDTGGLVVVDPTLGISSARRAHCARIDALALGGTLLVLVALGIGAAVSFAATKTGVSLVSASAETNRLVLCGLTVGMGATIRCQTWVLALPIHTGLVVGTVKVHGAASLRKHIKQVRYLERDE